MSKQTVVLFEKGKSPRIFKNPGNLARLQEKGRILINPAIPRGVPPHKWYLSNGMIKTTVKNKGYSKELKHHTAWPWFNILVVLFMILILSLQVYTNKEGLKKGYEFSKEKMELFYKSNITRFL